MWMLSLFKKKIKERVICPYCKVEAVLIDNSEVYARSYGPIWMCCLCGSYVGVHKNTTRPLGRLANKELRIWKQKAHEMFDPLWQKKMEITGCSRSEARGKAYAWLSKELLIDSKECHIGMFDVSECKRVVDLCSKWWK